MMTSEMTKAELAEEMAALSRLPDDAVEEVQGIARRMVEQTTEAERAAALADEIEADPLFRFEDPGEASLAVTGLRLLAVRSGDTFPGTPKTGPLMAVPVEATAAILDAMSIRIEEFACKGDGWAIGGADIIYDAVLAAAKETE